MFLINTKLYIVQAHEVVQMALNFFESQIDNTRDEACGRFQVTYKKIWSKDFSKKSLFTYELTA